MIARHVRLGVNIDHVATIRNARGGGHPDPARAAMLAESAGADGITIHLREDRRHIRDDDLERIRSAVAIPINLEMAATHEMTEIALSYRPHAICLVPERREERTTEGGLDAIGQLETIRPFVNRLADAGIRVSLFIEPSIRQIDAALSLRAPVVELHTGKYAEALVDGDPDAVARELGRLRQAAHAGAERGIEIHAGHGLTFENAGDIAAIRPVRELNIGHFLIGEAVFSGLADAIGRMRLVIDEGRGRAS
jgi:pyridoxine 5-phosphate synthase